MNTLQNKDKFTVKKLFQGHKDFNLSRMYKFEIADKAISNELFSTLTKSGYFEYVEYAPELRTSLTPNDLNINQWHLKKILAEQAWNIRTGNKNIRLAIVDDAVDINHEDLKSVIFLNTAEIPNNGIDDDANGYIDDYSGWHAFYNIGNPSPPFIGRDKFSHGTHCAGIAAAATNNNTGIASMGYNVSIVAVACADSTDPGKVKGGYEGIVYAADVGVNVISLSWGGSFFSNTGQQVMGYAKSKGVIVCAAAGNDNDDTPKYPAAYNGVIAVAATDLNDKRADFSNYGPWVDISAPGVDIWSSLTGGSSKYGYLSGTSMACPLVAGLCGLMLSQNDKLTPDEIEICLKSGAVNIDVINPGFINELGAGRINAQKSLQCVKPLYTDFVSDVLSVCPGASIKLTDMSSPHATAWKWTVNNAIPSQSTLKNPQFQLPVSGFYNVKLVVSDGVNFDSMEMVKYIEVSLPTAKMQTSTHKIWRGESAFLAIDLQGVPPWNIVVSDGATNQSFDGIASSPFYFEVIPLSTSKYFPVSVIDGRCKGIVSDTAYVKIDTSKLINNSGGCGSFDLFAKTIDMGSNEWPHSISRLSNGQYAIIGITSKGAIGGNDIFLTKLNMSGDVIWTKYYGTTSNENGYPLGVIEDSKGDMFIYGVSAIGSGETGLLIKLDSGGNVLFSKNSINNSAPDYKRQGRLLSNNLLGIAGTTGKVGDQAAEVICMASDGTIQWSRSFEAGGTQHFIGMNELNKKIYLAGHTSVGSGGYGSILSKVDLSGNLVWQKHIDYNTYDAFKNMVVTENSSLMMGAWLSINGSSVYGGYDIGVVHSDTNGNKIWAKVIGNSGKDDIGGLLRLNDAYYVSGTTSSFDNGNSKIFVIKMDINGNIKWSKIYGGVGEKIISYSFMNNIIEGHDGSIMIVAQKVNANDDVILLKIDECGVSNCPSQDVVFSIQNSNTTFSNSSLADIGILSQQALTISSANVSPSSIKGSDKCPVTKANIPKCKLVANFKYVYTCASDSVNLIDSSYDLTPKAIRHYKWIFHDNSVYIGSRDIKHLFPGPGSYKTTLIAFTDTPNVCSDTIVKFINIDNKLKASIIVDKNSICRGDSISLKAIPFCGVQPLTVKWYPAVYFANQGSFTQSIAIPSSMWIKFIVTDKNNFKASDSVYINVNQGCCKYNAMVKSNTYNICLNDSIDIQNISQNAGANYLWYLYRNGLLYDSLSATSLGKVKLSKTGRYTFSLKAFGNCQSAITGVDVFCHALPYIKQGRDTFVCKPSTIKLGYPAIVQRTYLWTPALNLDDNKIAQPVATVNQSADYILTVTDLSTGCINHDTIQITLSDLKVYIGNDTVLCEGAAAILTPGNQFNATYLWSDGSRSPALVARYPGVYHVTVSNKCGSFVDSINIGSKSCWCGFFMPNAFSPNNDATNEFFPYEHLETTVNMTIYNRWGEKLSERHNVNTGWDGYYKGEIVQQDVYLYLIEYINCRGRYEYINGTFTLLR